MGGGLYLLKQCFKIAITAKVDGAGVSAGRKRAFVEQEVPTPTAKKAGRRSLAVSKVNL